MVWYLVAFLVGLGFGLWRFTFNNGGFSVCLASVVFNENPASTRNAAKLFMRDFRYREPRRKLMNIVILSKSFDMAYKTVLSNPALFTCEFKTKNQFGKTKRINYTQSHTHIGFSNDSIAIFDIQLTLTPLDNKKISYTIFAQKPLLLNFINNKSVIIEPINESGIVNYNDTVFIYKKIGIVFKPNPQITINQTINCTLSNPENVAQIFSRATRAEPKSLLSTIMDVSVAHPDIELNQIYTAQLINNILNQHSQLISKRFEVSGNLIDKQLKIAQSNYNNAENKILFNDEYSDQFYTKALDSLIVDRLTALTDSLSAAKITYANTNHLLKYLEITPKLNSLNPDLTFVSYPSGVLQLLQRYNYLYTNYISILSMIDPANPIIKEYQIQLTELHQLAIEQTKTALKSAQMIVFSFEKKRAILIDKINKKPGLDKYFARIERTMSSTEKYLLFLNKKKVGINVLSQSYQPTDQLLDRISSTNTISLTYKSVLTTALNMVLLLFIGFSLFYIHSGNIVFPEQIEFLGKKAKLNTPLVGIIPSFKKTLHSKKILLAGQKLVRQWLFLYRRNEHLSKSVVAICSAQHNDGKTIIAELVAQTLHNFGHRTILIRADMRKPDREFIGKLGLFELLSGQISLSEAILIKQSGLPIIPPGSFSNTHLHLQLYNNLPDCIASIKNNFEYLVFDLPPLIFTEDNRLILQGADEVLLIARLFETNIELLRNKYDWLTSLKPNCVCLAINQYNKRPFEVV